ncbi:MAG: NUDIX domain-containing protein [Anaerolineae bacterium]|jgi:8-oxo-dGTP diphosphatase|nr:NUDIX domain-containing protein [Anaerolineae bacterium]
MQDAKQIVVATLVVVVHPDGEQILMGRKLRGFGKGKITGYGGKQEPDETPLQAIRREFHEESSFLLPEAAFEYAGAIDFEFPYHPDWGFECHVFRVDDFDQTPPVSDELDPRWVRLDGLPQSEMWADNAFWLALAAQGEHFTARFTYAPDNAHLESYHVRLKGA